MLAALARPPTVRSIILYSYSVTTTLSTARAFTATSLPPRSSTLSGPARHTSSRLFTTSPMVCRPLFSQVCPAWSPLTSNAYSLLPASRSPTGSTPRTRPASLSARSAHSATGSARPMPTAPSSTPARLAATTSTSAMPAPGPRAL